MTGHVWAYIPLWAMPRFSVMTGLNGIRASIEHADLGKPPHRLKSFSSNLLESFLISPFYMNYHGEHHAYMSVPIQHLPKLRRMFLTSDHARDFEVVPSYWHEYKRLISCMQQKTS
jgi:fatty acid desaturase